MKQFERIIGSRFFQFQKLNFQNGLTCTNRDIYFRGLVADDDDDGDDDVVVIQCNITESSKLSLIYVYYTYSVHEML